MMGPSRQRLLLGCCCPWGPCDRLPLTYTPAGSTRRSCIVYDYGSRSTTLSGAAPRAVWYGLGALRALLAPLPALPARLPALLANSGRGRKLPLLQRPAPPGQAPAS